MLVTLICDELGEAGISNILHELLKNSSLFQEWGVQPFARPYLPQPPRVEITVRRLPNNTLGALLRAKLPKDIHVRVQFSENKIFWGGKNLSTKLYKIDSSYSLGYIETIASIQTT